MPLSQPIVCPVLIGREAFTKALAELRAGASRGSGRVVLISGEAGIGKSRLMAELRAACLDDGWRVLEGNCFEQDQALPYSGWSDLFRRCFAGPSRDEALRALGRGGSEIARLLPELAGATATPAEAVADPQQQKQRLIAEVHRFLEAYGAGAPLAVLIEDVHWADESTLDLLAHLARSAPTSRLLLALSYRSDEVGETLGRTLAEFDRLRVASELALDRLDAGEVRDMLRATLGPAASIRGQFVDTVFSLTEGNPFFIEEVLRSVSTDGGASAPSEIGIPRTVREAVRRRFRDLSEPARRVAEYAAVAGRRFDFAVLRRICAVEEPRLLECVKELVGAQLIVEEAADQFSFRHALTREAIYTALLARERRQLHEQIATTLEDLNEDDPSRVAGDLSYHFFEAEQWAKALNYAALAAGAAGRAYAPRAAIEQYGRAIAAAGAMGQPAPAELHRGRGLAFEATGDFERARADQEQALKLAGGAGDRRGECQSLIDLGMLWAGRDYARTGDYFKKAFDLAQSLGDQSLLAHSMNRLGNWHLNVEEPLEALHYHRQALDLFRALGDKPGIAATLDLLGMASLLGGDMIGCHQYYLQAIELFRELDDKNSLTSALATITMCGRSGTHNQTMVQAPFNYEEAMTANWEALAIAQAVGSRPAESYCLWNRGVLVAAYGHFREALDRAQEGLAIAEEIEHRQWMAGAHHSLGVASLESLDFDGAERHMRLATDLAKSVGAQFWFRASAGFLVSALIAKSDLDGANEVLNGILTEDMPARTIGERILWCGAIELALAQGRHQDALDILDRLQAYASNTDKGRLGVRFCLLRGRTLRAAGTLAPAVEELSLGVADSEAEASRTMLWRLLLELAGSLQESGQDAEAAARLDQAAAVVLDLAPEVRDDWRDSFLARAAALFPPSHASRLRARPSTATPAGVLTRRELAVAELVAQGKSNRAIADDLVLSERTVETHVSNILGKLGFSSRAQVAAWAVENRLSEVRA